MGFSLWQWSEMLSWGLSSVSLVSVQEERLSDNRVDKHIHETTDWLVKWERVSAFNDGNQWQGWAHIMRKWNMVLVVFFNQSCLGFALKATRAIQLSNYWLLTINETRNKRQCDKMCIILLRPFCFWTSLQFKPACPEFRPGPGVRLEAAVPVLSCPVLLGDESLINSSIILNETIHRQADVDWNNLQHLYFQLLFVFLMNFI